MYSFVLIIFLLVFTDFIFQRIFANGNVKCGPVIINSCILDALNTRRSSTTQTTPYAAVFGQRPNDLSNISFNSDCPMEEDVEELLPEIQRQHDLTGEQQSESIDAEPIVPDEVLCSDQSSESLTCQTETETQKSSSSRPVPTPRILNKKSRPIPKPRKISQPNPPQPEVENFDADTDLPSAQIDFKKTLKRKDTGSITFSSLLKEKRSEILKPLPNLDDIVVSDDNDTNEEDELEEVEEVEVVNIDYDDLRLFLSSCEIPVISESTEVFALATIGQYSQKYRDAIPIIQQEVAKKNAGVKKCNNEYVDREISVAINIFCCYLENRNLPPSGIAHLTYSPRRSAIRKKVKENIKANGERMKIKYAKRKRLEVADYSSGDNVAVKIPPQDRGKCEVKRLPATVVLKRGRVHPKYKLACQYGTLESFYTASSLIRYPGAVNLSDNVDKEISLREAARKHAIVKANIVKCKCRTGCKTSHCICKKNGKNCFSGCHKGLKCNNCEDKRYERKKSDLPRWGGKHTINGKNYFFSNTCTVDNWLALFSIISSAKPEFYNEIVKEYFSQDSDFIAILGLVQKCEYNLAKFKLAKKNNLNLTRDTYDFYGNEHTLFIKHLEHFSKHDIISTCSYDSCPMKQFTEEDQAFPSFDTRIKEVFVESIKSWLTDGWSTLCSKPLAEPLPKDEYMYWDFNKET